MLVLTRKEDEKVVIDDDIEITVVAVEGGKVQLGIDAPQEVEIYREEIYEKVKSENIEATRKKVTVDQLKEIRVDNSEKEDN